MKADRVLRLLSRELLLMSRGSSYCPLYGYFSVSNCCWTTDGSVTGWSLAVAAFILSFGVLLPVWTVHRVDGLV